MLSNKLHLKAISIVVLSFFTYSFVLQEPLLALTDLLANKKNAQKLEDSISRFILPSGYGRIIDGNYNNSDTLVIYIQDLHCHAEAQKNISNIINLFDARYPLSKIFSEGAPEGKVDTHLLSSLPDKAIKKMVLNDLLSDGLLSGAEYYSVAKDRDILYGLENWEIYLSNLNRVRGILEKRGSYAGEITKLRYKVTGLKKKMLSKKIQELESYLNSSNARKDTGTYYLEMGKLCDKLGIAITGYPNLDVYIKLLRSNSGRDSKKLEKEFKQYYGMLKRIIPYSLYGVMMQKLNDPDRSDEFYLSLSEIAKTYTPNMSYAYPEINSFLKYKTLNYCFNPIYMLSEEKLLKKKILNSFSDRLLYKEILFLSDMSEILNDLLNLKITPDDLATFENNCAKYKVLLGKFFENSDTTGLTAMIDEENIHEFYKTNIQRDDIFYNNLLKNIKNEASGTPPAVPLCGTFISDIPPLLTFIPRSRFAGGLSVRRGKDLNQSLKSNYATVLNHLKEFKEINVVVTGGFHSKITEFIKKGGISYLNIIPNVTHAADESIYSKILTDNFALKDFLSSSFAPELLDLGTSKLRIELLMLKWTEEAHKQGMSAEEIKAELTRWMSENPSITVKLDIDSMLADGSINVVLDGTKVELPQKGPKGRNRVLKIPKALASFFKKVFSKRKQKTTLPYSPAKAMLNDEYRSLANSLSGPMPDLVLVMSGNSDMRKEALEELFAKRPEVMSNVPFEVIGNDGDGSGRAILEAFKYLSPERIRGLGERYPSLKDKKIENLRILVLAVDGLDKDTISAPLPVKINGKNITPIELALLNGLKAVQNLTRMGKGGMVIMDPASVYLGPVKPTGDITLLGSYVGYGQMLEQGLTLMLNDDKTGRVRKLYNRFNEQQIKNTLEKNAIRGMYHLGNKKLKQMQSMTGNIILSFDSPDKYDRFNRLMEDVRSWVNTNYKNKAPPGFDLTTHLLVPLVMLYNGEDANAFCVKLRDTFKNGDDLDFYKDFYFALFELYRNKFNLIKDINIKTQLPAESLYSRIYTGQDPPSTYNDQVLMLGEISVPELTLPAITQAKKNFSTRFKKIESNTKKSPAADSLILSGQKSSERDDNINPAPWNPPSLDGGGMRSHSSLKGDRFKEPSASDGGVATEKRQSRAETGVTAIEKSEQLLEEWAQLLDANKKDFDPGVYDNMLEKAKGIMRLTRLSEESFGNNNKPMAMLYRKFSSLSISTVEQLAGILNKNPAEDKEQAKLVHVRDSFESISVYSLEYLHTIDFAVNLEILSGYIYPKNDWMEKYKIMPLNRLIFGMADGFEKSKLGLGKQVDKVVGTGNLLLDSLYDYPQTKSEINMYVQALEHKNGEHSLGLDKLWRSRKAIQRSSSLFLSFRTILTSSLWVGGTSCAAQTALVGGNPILASILFSIVIPLGTGIVLSIFLHQFFIQQGRTNGFYNRQKRVINKHLNRNPWLKKSIDSTIKELSSVPEGYLLVQKPEENAKTVFGASKDCLDAWGDILKLDKFDKNALDAIRSNAGELIRLTHFSNIMLVPLERKKAVIVFDMFLELAKKTANKIHSLPAEEKEKLKNEIASFSQMYEYANDYLYALDCANNIEVLSIYRISKNSRLYFLEQSQLMNVVRAIFGISVGIVLSSLFLRKTSKNLVTKGNGIIPGFYDAGKISGEVNDFIKQNKYSVYFELGMSEGWRDRKMLARFIPLIVFWGPFLESYLFGTPLTPGGFLVTFATGLGLSLVLHWIPIILSLFNKNFSRNKKIIRSIKRPPVFETEAEGILRNEYQELLESFNNEKPDLVFIVADTDEGLQAHLKAILPHKTWDQFSVPFVFIKNTGKGNGSTLLEVFEPLKADKFSRLAEKYPSLRGKDIGKLRIVALNINGMTERSLGQALPARINETSLTVLELALLNGLKALRSLRQENRGGMAIIDPSSIYLGPIKRTGDITLLGSNVSYSQMLGQSLTLMIEERKTGKIDKIYHEFNNEEVTNMLAKKGLNSMYDLNNKQVKQLKALTGNMIVSFDDPDKFNKFIDLLGTIKYKMISQYGNKVLPEIDLMPHLIIPFLMLSKNEDPLAFCMKLRKNGQSKQENDFYWNLFRLYENAYRDTIKELDINTFIPPEAVFTVSPGHFKESLAYLEQIKLLKKFSGNQEIEETIKLEAGVQNEGFQVKKNETEGNQDEPGFRHPVNEIKKNNGSELLDKKIARLQELKEEGKIYWAGDHIPATLLYHYSLKTIEKRAEIMYKYGYKYGYVLNTYTIRLKDESEVREWIYKKTVPGIIKDALRHARRSGADPIETIKTIRENVLNETVTESKRWLFENAPGFCNKSIVFSCIEDEEIVDRQMLSMADLSINALKVTLMYQNTASAEGQLIDLNTKVIVPVENIDVIARIYARVIESGAGNKSVKLYLRPLPAIEQESDPARMLVSKIEDSQGLENDAEKRDIQMLLLGRGTLAVIKEITEGNPELKRQLVDLGLPVQDIVPAVVSMRGVLSVFTQPQAIADSFINDEELNSLVFTFNTDSLKDENEVSKLVLSSIKKINLNENLLNYSIISSGAVDLRKIALVTSDISASLNQAGAMPGIDYYPEFQDMVYEPASGIAPDDAEAAKSYLKELLYPAYKTKNCVSQKTRKNNRRFGSSTNRVQIAPVVSINNIGDIRKLCDKLSPDGINTLLLQPVFPVFKAADSSVCGSMSSFCVDPFLVDLVEEAGRLRSKKAAFSSVDIESFYSIIKDEEEQSAENEKTTIGQNRFYVALRCYNEFLKNKEEQKKFAKFKDDNEKLWPEIEKGAKYFSAVRILGAYPQDAKMIDDLVKIAPDKWILYPKIYEYLQYVAYRQLRESIDYAHKKGMGIIMNYPILKARNSSDMIYHPDYFCDKERDTVSPNIGGKVENGLVLGNWRNMQKSGYGPVVTELKYWLENFGFEGVWISGINAYESIKDSDFSYNLLLSRLTDAVRSSKPEATIIVEPFKGYSVDYNSGQSKSIYSFLSISDPGQLTQDRIKKELEKMGNAWLRIDLTSGDTGETFMKTLSEAIRSGCSEYISFELSSQFDKAESISGANLSELIASLKDIIVSKKPDTQKSYFNEGYMYGSNLDIGDRKALINAELNGFETMELTYSGGKNKLASLGAPGLHLLLAAYRCINNSKENGTDAFLNHAGKCEFFSITYRILKKAGLTESVVPEIWFYLKKLQKHADTVSDPKEKVNVNIQLFGFIQGLLEEQILYPKYSGQRSINVGSDTKIKDLLAKYVSDSILEFDEKDMQLVNEIDILLKDLQNMLGFKASNGIVSDVFFKKLLVAADSFIVHDGPGGVRMLAHPNDGVKTKDVFMCLPGLFLVTRRYDEAKKLFRYYANLARTNGRLPGFIINDGRLDYDTEDGSLWFVEALNKYYKANSSDVDFMREMLDVTNIIVDGYLRPNGKARLDTDGLVSVPPGYYQSPKQNSEVSNTGREKPIEVQALLYNALSIASKLNRSAGDEQLAEKYDVIRQNLATAINRYYFVAGRAYPLDVLGTDPASADAIRPNALSLISLSQNGDFLSSYRQKAMLKVIDDSLVTQYGLRTLSPGDPRYRQGTNNPYCGVVFPWLISPYLIAKRDDLTVTESERIINILKHLIIENGTLPEFFTPDQPYMPGGSESYAKSVAALLEVAGAMNSNIEIPLPEKQNVFNLDLTRKLAWQQ
ncbi:MAG: 4-alpha-glucanotransferase [Elusimicrobia bacterium]|nr:4-alpha-glucanotransferase [Candidatus Liberimonas magnetica]